MSSVLSHGQLTVPPGLPAALESLARAVLKEQPDDLPKFAAQHFHILLNQRDQSGRDPFSDSVSITEQTVPPKFDAPLPASQRTPPSESPCKEEDMGSGASKSKTPVQVQKEEEPAPPSPAPVESQPQQETESADNNSLQDTSAATDGPDSTTNERSTPTEGPDSEAVDIDLNDPDVNDAAVKIQAAFRGHQVRKDQPKEDDAVEEASAPETAPQEPPEEKTQAPAEEEEIDIDLNDPKTEEAAVKIQSAFRGHQVRQDMKDKPAEPETAEPEADAKQPAAEEVDIDLDDPASLDAAVKIQAAFRGHQVRSEMQSRMIEECDERPKNDAALLGSPTTEEKPLTEEIDIDLTDPNTEDAAVKIQAAFRGHQVRKVNNENNNNNITSPAPVTTDEAEPVASEAPKDG